MCTADARSSNRIGETHGKFNSSLTGWGPGSRLHASLSLDGTNWTKLSSIVCRKKRCPNVFHHITAWLKWVITCQPSSSSTRWTVVRCEGEGRLVSEFRFIRSRVRVADNQPWLCQGRTPDYRDGGPNHDPFPAPAHAPLQ